MQIVPIFKRISKASHIVALGALMMVSIACPNHLDGVSMKAVSMKADRVRIRTVNGKVEYVDFNEDVTLSFKQHGSVDGLAMYRDGEFLTGVRLQNPPKGLNAFRVIDTATDEKIGTVTFNKDKELTSAFITFGFSEYIIWPETINLRSQ